MFIRAMLSLYLSFTFVNAAHAEVSDVIITWTKATCQPGCDKLLSQQFGKIYGIETFDINRLAGQANIKWKPNLPFAYYPINAAMRMVGPHINSIRVKVRGKIQHSQGNVKLISEGDGTQFYLISAVNPAPNQYALTRSVYNRLLSLDVRQQLLDAETKKQMVIIDGPLFEPYRSPPLFLVIEHLSLEENK